MNNPEWTIQGLALTLEQDLLACHTQNERINCEALSGIAIRNRAQELLAQGRLTPAGRAIAEKFGFRIKKG